MMSHRPRGYQWSSLGHYKVVSTMWFSVEQLRTLQSSIDHVVLSGATQDIAKSYRSHGSQWSSSLQSRIDHVVISGPVQDMTNSSSIVDVVLSGAVGTLQSRIDHAVLYGAVQDIAKSYRPRGAQWSSQDITKSYRPRGSQWSSLRHCKVVSTTWFSVQQSRTLQSRIDHMNLSGAAQDITKLHRPRGCQWSSLGHYRVVSSTWFSVEQLRTLQSRINHVVLSRAVWEIVMSHRLRDSQSYYQVIHTIQFLMDLCQTLRSGNDHVILNEAEQDTRKSYRPHASRWSSFGKYHVEPTTSLSIEQHMVSRNASIPGLSVEQYRILPYPTDHVAFRAAVQDIYQSH